MVVNWTPEGISDFFMGIVLLIATLLIYFAPKKRKINSLSFIRIGVILLAVGMLLHGFSLLYLSHFLSRLCAFFWVFGFGFWIIGLNLIVNDSYNSIFLFIYGCIGAIICYLAFQPNVTGIKIEMGYTIVRWRGMLNVLGDLIQGIGALIIIYWGSKTWRNTPFFIKKDSLIYLTGIILMGPITIIVYFFYYFDAVFIIWTNIFFSIGVLIFNIAIVKEPKLLYILPFTVYRIIIKDREGAPLYDYDWSESNINENIFTGFLNAVQLMSEEVMNIGGILDISLENGILIVYESKYITVGLVSSKSSKLLRDTVIEFTQDFERKFEWELKKFEKDMKQYLGAFELIKKHFSTFPSKIIKSKKQPLLLTGKYQRIPLELDNKLRSMFTNEKEYEAIKTELIKSPLSIPSNFIKSYDEMQKELQQISKDEMKYLDLDSDLDE
ncbi:MAG: hypothetical protein ACFFCE_16815 [Promethearchaeota archaeon]